jgi:hypothetical protein
MAALEKAYCNPRRLTENSDNTVETQDVLHNKADKLIKFTRTLKVTNDLVRITHRLNMELDLQCLFELYTAVLIS